MNRYFKFCKHLLDQSVSYFGRTEAWTRPVSQPESVTSPPLTIQKEKMPPKKAPAATSHDGPGSSSMSLPNRKPAAKVVTARGYKRPDALSEGFLIEDKLNKRSWRIGDLIGQGGFADVYAVSDHVSKPVSLATAKHVLKLEPLSNGPLFQEIKFFKAAAKKDSIAAFMALHKLKSLGVMEYVASGVIDYNDKELRWLVIPRLGQCVQTIFEQSGGRFARHSVIMLALQLIDVLEYIHSQGFAHGDIKAGNLMTGLAKIDANQVFLIDFGLVKKFMTEGQQPGVLQHNPYKEDLKSAHDGTLEFTSIDAHKGVAPSRRGDMQILGFNLIKWLVGALPWSDSHDANFVKTQKMAYLQNITEFFRVAFPAGETSPKELVDYFKEIKALEYTDKPNYAKLRAIFQAAYKEAKVRKSGLFQAPAAEITTALPPSSPKKRGRKPKTAVEDLNGDGPEELAKKPTAKPTKSVAGTNGRAGDVAKPAVQPRKKAAKVASTSGMSHASEVATTLASLPPGQRRKVKAALEDADDDRLTEGVLAALPPGQRRKLKAAAAEDAADRNGHVVVSQTSSDDTTDSGPPVQRSLRAAKTARNYAEEDVSDNAGKGGKRAKK